MIRKFEQVDIDTDGKNIESTRVIHFIVFDDKTGIEIKCPTLEIAIAAEKNNVARNLLSLSVESIIDNL